MSSIKPLEMQMIAGVFERKGGADSNRPRTVGHFTAHQGSSPAKTDR